jgi:hypothetical protein
MIRLTIYDGASNKILEFVKIPDTLNVRRRCILFAGTPCARGFAGFKKHRVFLNSLPKVMSGQPFTTAINGLRDALPRMPTCGVSMPGTLVRTSDGFHLGDWNLVGVRWLLGAAGVPANVRYLFENALQAHE